MGAAQVLGYKATATHHKTIVVNNPAAPLKIERASAFTLPRYAREDLAAQMGLRGRGDFLKGRIVSINAPSENVSAAKFGVLFYDSFNEAAGGFTAIVTKRPTKEMIWSDRENIAWRRYGIACVFVRAVRLSDGQVWKADLKKIARMMVESGCSSTNRKSVMERLKALPRGAVRL